jgi:cell division protein YceG involved in septum cleavage
MTVAYEWAVECVDPESDDVLDVNHYDRLREIPYLEPNERVVLVRTSQAGRFTDMLYAYPVSHAVDGSVLPETFEFAGDETEVRVPARFHAEYARERERLGK